jgi:hypothetical protein
LFPLHWLLEHRQRSCLDSFHCHAREIKDIERDLLRRLPLQIERRSVGYIFQFSPSRQSAFALSVGISKVLRLGVYADAGMPHSTSGRLLEPSESRDVIRRLAWRASSSFCRTRPDGATVRASQVLSADRTLLRVELTPRGSLPAHHCSSRRSRWALGAPFLRSRDIEGSAESTLEPPADCFGAGS